MWQGLRASLQKTLVDDTNIHIKKMLQESGHIPDHGSYTPPEDKEAIEYMDLRFQGTRKEMSR